MFRSKIRTDLGIKLHMSVFKISPRSWEKTIIVFNRIFHENIIPTTLTQAILFFFF